MKRGLIFNADDYGLSPAVSSGIRQAMASGAVRSTTVMANFCSGEELAALRALLVDDAAAAVPRGLTAGCHLNLSAGRPLTADYPAQLLRPGPDGGPWLDKARALSPATWVDRDLVVFAAVEWAAQLALLRESGLPLTHLDSHHHVHLLPALFPVALDLAQQHGLALRVRREYRSLARASEVACPDALLEGYFGQGHIAAGDLLTMLHGADGEVVEVMCHPGMVDELLRQRSGYVGERQTELEVLTDPGVLAALEAQGWQLRGYAWTQVQHEVAS
jgi:predicted glycoside hydrolase/deacetylase ChbG (UPF0249 family)